MKKKATSLVLAIAACCSLYIPASAVDDTVGHLVYESGEVSEATIEDVDRLIHERNCAIMDGDSSINNLEGTYSATIYAGEKDDYTAEAQLKEYFTTYLCNYDSQVTSIILKDVNGDTIYSRGLVCPHNTSEIY